MRNERLDKQMKSMTYCTALFENEMRLHRFLAVLAIALSVNIAVTNDARASGICSTKLEGVDKPGEKPKISFASL